MTADFPAPDPIDDEPADSVWEKAFAQHQVHPDNLAEFPTLHLVLMRDFLDQLADAKYGADKWVMRAGPVVEEFEPESRSWDYPETDDDGNPVTDEAGNQVVVTYRDVFRYFRMTAYFRAKGQGE